MSCSDGVHYTLVGTQKDFREALENLIELDYAAAASYQEAIEHLKYAEYKRKLKEFQHDHERHIKEFGEIIRKMGHEPPTGAGIKQLFTQGKVMFANLIGDKAILKAMKSNEDDTNTAYERLNDHIGKTEETRELLRRGLEDERKHRQWIEQAIKEFEEVHA